MITDKQFQELTKQAEIDALIMQYGPDYTDPVKAAQYHEKLERENHSKSTVQWDKWIKSND